MEIIAHDRAALLGLGEEVRDLGRVVDVLATDPARDLILGPVLPAVGDKRRRVAVDLVRHDGDFGLAAKDQEHSREPTGTLREAVEFLGSTTGNRESPAQLVSQANTEFGIGRHGGTILLLE